MKKPVTNDGRDVKSKLHERVGVHASRKQYRRALEVLDQVIEESMPLFQGEEWVLDERRLAWLYRIDLLREWGRPTEALAWACLEAELRPNNVTAIALKQRLKREAGFMVEPGGCDGSGTSKTTAIPHLWEGVSGMRELKAMLERDVLLPLQEPEVYAKYRLSLPNGILLYGPPGCGKTFIARRLATILGFEFIEVTPGDLASIYVHGTQGKIAELFSSAEAKAPCMIFFDEIDAMVPSRDRNSVGHHYASEVNEFLVRLNECARKRILVVGATNLPKRMDPAVLRPGRLDKKLFVGPPDYEARVELLRLCMKNRPQESIEWQGCALELDNYTCAEIEFVVNEAARSALGQQRPIATVDILQSATNNRPAHTPAMIEQMRKL